MLLFPRDQSDRRKPGRPRISQSSSHVDLRIRFVQDWDVNVISPKGKFKTAHSVFRFVTNVHWYVFLGPYLKIRLFRYVFV